jgi:hypothetical protein
MLKMPKMASECDFNPFLAFFSIGEKIFELKSFMSYCALFIGVILFLASTVSGGSSDKSSSKSKKYKDDGTNI